MKENQEKNCPIYLDRISTAISGALRRRVNPLGRLLETENVKKDFS
jgi:hypothetical protein